MLTKFSENSLKINNRGGWNNWNNCYCSSIAIIKYSQNFLQVFVYQNKKKLENLVGKFESFLSDEV